MMTATKTKKDRILEAIERMDTGMLDLLLADEKTYFDVRKGFFLEKLQLTFDAFRKRGDTKLLRHAGICNSNYCSNKGCTGYAFVGDKTEAYMQWLVKETEDDVEDIFHCSGLRRLDGIEAKGEYMYLDITEDEKVTFEQNEADLMMSHYCRVALDEYLEFEGDVIATETYTEWLRKHKALFFTFKLPPYDYREQINFHELFSELRSYHLFFISNLMVKAALEEFRSMDKQDDIAEIRWLVRYDVLREKLEIHINWRLKLTSDDIDACILIYHRKIRAIYYIEAAAFCDVHEDRYWDLYGRNSVFRRWVKKKMKAWRRR